VSEEPDKQAAGDSGELFLIDGNSLAYRAFFALPESMATSDGRPTNAIYGLASMMVKVLTDHRPAAVVVAWDAGMSGREKTYADYKAQRPPRPDLLREQWPHLMPLAEAFGFTNVKVEGWEADDVIASLTRLARQRGIEVMAVTGDRDAYQLVDDGVRVMSTSRGVTDTKIYDRDVVIERWGVPPEARDPARRGADVYLARSARRLGGKRNCGVIGAFCMVCVFCEIFSDNRIYSVAALVGLCSN
jgi:DNA polymerase-1